MDSLHQPPVICRVDPYYDDESMPDRYKAVVDVNAFHTTSLSKILSDRGIVSRELNSLINVLHPGVYIAGSFVASILDKSKTYGDIDLFFANSEAFIDTYMRFMDTPDGSQFSVFRGYTSSKSLSDMSVGFGANIPTVELTPDVPSRPKIQLVKLAWFNSPEHLLNSFDFTVTQFCVHQHAMTYNPCGIIDLFTNKIVIAGSQSPLEMMKRIVKYAKKGYEVPMETMVSSIKSIKESPTIGPKLKEGVEKYK